MDSAQNKQTEKKELIFKGNKYIAIPEKVEKACKGCALENKGCYTSVRALSICRQGFIFKRVKK